MAFSFKKIFGNFRESSNPETPTTVGIDIGSASVKVVEIEQTPLTIKLRTYGELQLGPYENLPLGEVVAIGGQKRIEAVTDVMREAGVSGRNGALAMPLTSSFLTVVPLPQNGQEDLSTRIPVEARKYVPLPLTDVTLDWMEMPAISGDKTGVKEVLLAAIENKSLAEQRELLSSIGMVGEAAEIEAFCLIRSLWRAKDTTLVVIDLGARSSKIYIVRQGQLERVHRVAVGGREITRLVAERLKCSFEDAENLKREYDRDSEQGRVIFQVMTQVLDGPLTEFGRLIGQYESRIGEQIGRIVISGGVSSAPYALSYIKDRFARPLELAHTFAKVAYPAFMEDTLKAIGPSFGVALGAALRQFQ
jgi:type IV pilus assembly protein PilM